MEVINVRINKAKLAFEMARCDMRYKQLVELSGVSRTTLSLISCGKSCTHDTALKIAKALNIPLNNLIESETPQWLNR